MERVLPQVDVRQWVLTFSFAWRRRLAQDGALLGMLTRLFVPDAGKPKDNGALYAKNPKGLKHAGITKRVTIHGLRRTATDLFRRASVDPVTAKAIIGHTTDGHGRAGDKALRGSLVRIVQGGLAALNDTVHVTFKNLLRREECEPFVMMRGVVPSKVSSSGRPPGCPVRKYQGSVHVRWRPDSRGSLSITAEGRQGLCTGKGR